MFEFAVLDPEEVRQRLPRLARSQGQVRVGHDIVAFDDDVLDI